MRRIFLLTMSAILALVLSIGTETRDVFAATAANQSIAVPSYFYPGAQWTQMERASATVGVAIINPMNGPGKTADPAYADQVRKSREAGLQVLGYVYTGYGTRSASEVKADVDRYYSWYGVDGIFFDEASTDCQHANSYYAELYGHVKAKGSGSKVILNPGTQTRECYMAVSDVVLTFEGSYKSYTSSYSAPAWVSDYSPSRFWHVIYSTSTTRAMERAVTLSKNRGAGWVYVTPDVLPNPWDTLPTGSYWSKELAAVS